jgi:hypothetical protein
LRPLFRRKRAIHGIDDGDQHLPSEHVAEKRRHFPFVRTYPARGVETQKMRIGGEVNDEFDCGRNQEDKKRAIPANRLISARRGR